MNDYPDGLLRKEVHNDECCAIHAVAAVQGNNIFHLLSYSFSCIIVAVATAFNHERYIYLVLVLSSIL